MHPGLIKAIGSKAFDERRPVGAGLAGEKQAKDDKSNEPCDGA